MCSVQPILTVAILRRCSTRCGSRGQQQVLTGSHRSTCVGCVTTARCQRQRLLRAILEQCSLAAACSSRTSRPRIVLFLRPRPRSRRKCPCSSAAHVRSFTSNRRSRCIVMPPPAWQPTSTRARECVTCNNRCTLGIRSRATPLKTIVRGRQQHHRGNARIKCTWPRFILTSTGQDTRSARQRCSLLDLCPCRSCGLATACVDTNLYHRSTPRRPSRRPLRGSVTLGRYGRRAAAKRPRLAPDLLPTTASNKPSKPSWTRRTLLHRT